MAAITVANTTVRLRAQDPPVNAALVGTWNGGKPFYKDVWSDGDYVYVAGAGPWVYIIDISDPSKPQLDETFFVPDPNDDAPVKDVKTGDGLLFIALDGAGLCDNVSIVDIRNPNARIQIAKVDVSALIGAHNVFYDSGFLYIADSWGPWVGIVDLTAFDPDNPPASSITEKWIIQNVGTSKVHDITVLDGRLYVAAWDSGLWVYDVSDVANTMPAFLGSVDGQSTHSMWATSDGHFVVTGEERVGGGIKVYEINENGGALTFALRDSLAFPTAEVYSVHNQVIVGHRLFNSWYHKGLQVFDIDPTTGKLLFAASFDTTDIDYGSSNAREAHDASAPSISHQAGNFGVYPFLGEDRILLSDRQNGLFIVQVTAPHIPSVSQWGLVVLTLLLLAAGTVILRARRAGPTANL